MMASRYNNHEVVMQNNKLDMVAGIELLYLIVIVVGLGTWVVLV